MLVRSIIMLHYSQLQAQNTGTHNAKDARICSPRHRTTCATCVLCTWTPEAGRVGRQGGHHPKENEVVLTVLHMMISCWSGKMITRTRPRRRKRKGRISYISIQPAPTAAAECCNHMRERAGPTRVSNLPSIWQRGESLMMIYGVEMSWACLGRLWWSTRSPVLVWRNAELSNTSHHVFHRPRSVMICTFPKWQNLTVSRLRKSASWWKAQV